MSSFLPFKCNLETFIEDLHNILNENENTIKKLLEQKNKTYKNFIKPLESIEERLEDFFTPLSHLNSVNNSKTTQDIYTQALPLITKYSTQLSQNIFIYQAYKEIQKKEKELTKEQKRVIELNIQNFELSGAHLNQNTKKRLQEINLKLSELSNNFSQNLLNATNDYKYIITNEKDMEGIPESEKKQALFEENGIKKYKFTLQMPSYITYMTYGTNRNIREELYHAYVTRAPENEKIIEEILSLRDEMAHLLGFENYATYSIASKMAPTTQSVLKFLNELLTPVKPQAIQEVQKLQSIAKYPLESYDITYYSEQLKQTQYDIEEEEYRPYFEQESVVKGLFSFLEKIFQIHFIETKENLWNSKAKAYNVYENNRLKARIFLDLEARESKKGGAWMHNWQSHSKEINGKEKLASAFIVCNFPPSSPNQPSLLRHDDVVTLFHEMGHTIHHILSNVQESSVSGVNGVEWDAVEYPSQFLENFAYEPKVLKLFAKHIKTQEVLPDNMIKKLVKSRNFLSAMGMLRQLEFSLFDFQLHIAPYNSIETQDLLNSIRKKTTLIPIPSYNKFQNGFAHIFAGGYAAGYYSYKWAEVLSADSFYAVVDEGIFHSKTAQDYLEIILHRGGSQSMKTLFFELMQRESDIEQLLRLNGINT